jgi:GT2 family glycosyltransferase
MQLSIIIVNYNVKFFLEHCLLSVIKACKNIKAEIFVVDNNSTDGSEEYLSPKFPSVKFYWNKTNPGFGKANNSVLNEATGDYVLFLNPDTIVPEDCFTKCISFFESYKYCGALGVRMIDGSGTFLKESKRCVPTPTAGFFKMIGLAKIFPTSSLFAGYYAGHIPEKENNKAEVLAGAYMMLSKKAIEITKGFDEDFFMYGEDIDLSYRIIKAGLQNYYLGETTIIHFKGESTQKRSADYVNYFYGAIKRFVGKHYSHQPFMKFCMVCIINSGKLFATIKNIFTPNKGYGNIQLPLKILFAGSNMQLDKISSILQNSNYQIIQNNILETVTELENLFVDKNTDSSINAILLCEGEITNIAIIEKLKILPKFITALFYEDGAESIIGSNNKNEQGIFISAQ